MSGFRGGLASDLVDFGGVQAAGAVASDPGRFDVNSTLIRLATVRFDIISTLF